jgi:hypothetical protein
MEDWMRTTEKKVMALERRPVVQTAGDILGPTIAPYVSAVTDCNAAVTVINGFFYVPIGTPNSPGSALGWMVQTIAQADGYGMQIARPEHDGTGGLTTGPESVRRFWAPGGSTPRIFSSWDLGDSGWIPAILQNGYTNLDATQFDSAGYRKVNGIVYLRGMLANGTRTSATIIFTLPPGYRIGGTSGSITTHQAITTGSPTTDGSPPRININWANGNVLTNYVPATNWISLNGVCFPADA